jgi:regulator of protease activity HflC (stomatin/prohibitin superfamily)
MRDSLGGQSGGGGVMDFFRSKLFKGILIVLGILILFLILNPMSCVGPTDRAVRIHLGAVQDGLYKPGLVWKAPFVDRWQKYSISPVLLDTKIPVNADGAISKDNQTIGMEIAFFYQYDPNRIVELARGYSLDSLTSILQRTVVSAAKTVIGTHTIFDVAANQDAITKSVREMVTASVSQYPIIVTDLKLMNYDWSDSFDKQISQTMEQAQIVKQKEQELAQVKLEAQQQVVKAEAERQATIARAEGEKQRVALEAEAKVLEGEGIRKYNQSLSATLDIQIKLKQLDIEMVRVQKWNGAYVANNNYGPIPVSTGTVQGR